MNKRKKKSPNQIISSEDMSKTDNTGCNLLQVACYTGCFTLATRLIKIKRGADINKKCNERWTPLHLASRQGHYLIVRFVCKSGANTSTTNIDGNTLLHLACQKWQPFYCLGFAVFGKKNRQ
jgi:ankyrin repeat protein